MSSTGFSTGVSDTKSGVGVLGRGFSQSNVLFYKLKDLSLSPSTHIKLPGVVACACDPSGEEAERRVLVDPWPVGVAQSVGCCQ